MNNNLNEALRLLRIFNDYKAKDLANALGVSPSYISEIERGDKRPSIDIIEKYAAHFHVRPSSIFFFSEEIDNDGRKEHPLLQKSIITFMKTLEKFGGYSNGKDEETPSV